MELFGTQMTTIENGVGTIDGMYLEVFLTLLGTELPYTKEQKIFLIRCLQISRLISTETKTMEIGFSDFYERRNASLLGTIENKEARQKQIVTDWFNEYDELLELELEHKFKTTKLEVAKLYEATKLETAKLEKASRH